MDETFTANDLAKELKISPWAARQRIIKSGIPSVGNAGTLMLYALSDKATVLDSQGEQRQPDCFNAADVARASGKSVQLAYLAINATKDMPEPAMIGKVKWYPNTFYEDVLYRVKNPQQTGPKLMWAAITLAKAIRDARLPFDGVKKYWDAFRVAADIAARSIINDAQPDGEKSLDSVPSAAWRPEQGITIASWYGVTMDLNGKGTAGLIPHPLADYECGSGSWDHECDPDWISDGTNREDWHKQYLIEQGGLLPVFYIQDTFIKHDSADAEIETAERNIQIAIDESTRHKAKAAEQQKKVLDDFGY